MAEEEFEESEVIFSDNSCDIYGTHDEDAAAVHQEDDDDDGYFDYRGFYRSGRVSHSYANKSKSNTTKRKKKKIAASSLPVNIPRHHGSIFHCGGEADDFEEEDEDDEEGQIVPPHVILGRRIAGKMAFSVCTGNGRTLKGRDLSQVRNSILRMTGFLEA